MQKTDTLPVAWWHSRRFRYFAVVFSVFFSVCIGFRLIFLFGFSALELNAEVVQGFAVGSKFDARLSVLLTLPTLILASLPVINLTTSALLRVINRIWLIIALAVTSLIYIIDLGHYAYLGKRIDSTVNRFLDDPMISAVMVWQSYPVIWITLGFLALLVVIWLILRWVDSRTLCQPARPISRIGRTIAVAAMLFVIVDGIHGRLLEINLHNPVPLRWNDAMISQNHAVNALGLNPILFLYDTFEQRELPYDEEAVAIYHSAVADYLGVTDQSDLNLDRRVEPAPHKLVFDRPPNIIFIMLESLGASRLGIYGNPISPSPSPHLDKLASEGELFENFFVPVSGTARTVWASLTGLPDVLSVKTASRNPFIAHQRVVLNHLTDHDKLYFIGGAAGWANMSAFIQQSIPDIELFEEQDWESPIVDVWGISDYDLFHETNEKLKQQADKPFFAFIQTAGNHRPFTIPANNGDFVARQDISEEELTSAGFRSLAQFNAVRLLDYNIGYFIELAEAAGYLENSIIVMFGDHNNRVTTTDKFMPPHFDALDLDGLHVPLIIYAPGYLEPRLRTESASLLDLMPTMAGLLGAPYLNTTMGRDLNAPVPESDRAVYVQTSDKRFPVIGLVGSEFALRMNRDGSNAKLHPVGTPAPWKDVAKQHPQRFEEMSKTARGLYELTRYQMYANSPED